MSRHSFALSVLLYSLASLLLLSPVQGQSVIGSAPANAMLPLAQQGFCCIFVYEFFDSDYNETDTDYDYDYSDYDYNDYDYSDSSSPEPAVATDAAPPASDDADAYRGCYEGYCWGSGAETAIADDVAAPAENEDVSNTAVAPEVAVPDPAEEADVATDALPTSPDADDQSSCVEEMVNYGCAGYLYDDYDLYGYEYGEVDTFCAAGSVGTCGNDAEMSTESTPHEVATPAEIAAGLTADYDPAYNEIVYGVSTRVETQTANPIDCETYCWGEDCCAVDSATAKSGMDSIEPETQRLIEESAADLVDMIHRLADRISATRPPAPAIFLTTARLLGGDIESQPGEDRANHRPFDFSLGVFLPATTTHPVELESAKQQTLLEAAATLEGAATGLLEAAYMLRRLARDDRVSELPNRSWKGIPFRR